MNTQFKINEQQLNYLENLHSSRYQSIQDNILNPQNNKLLKPYLLDDVKKVKRYSIHEQSKVLSEYIQNILNNKNITGYPDDTSSIEFIAYMDKYHFRFDSVNGELMTMGWEFYTNTGNKIFLTGQTNLSVDDKQIKRADKIAYKVFGMSLKDALSNKFGVIADWKQFAI